MADKSQSVTTIDTGTINARRYQVILFNDETHGMAEVAIQIFKAIHCDENEVIRIMMEAHVTGRASVITAGLERCELVESILAEIRLGTKIEEV